MFIGHFAVGFAAKRAAPRVSLPVLLAAPLLLDIVWPVLVAAGVEKVRIVKGATAASPLVLDYMPYSHGLVAALLWSAAFVLAYLAIARDRRGALVVGSCVASHWVLDWIAHAPDMPILHGDGPRYGLGLWDSIPGTLIVECGMLAVGAWLYATATRARDRIGRFAFAGLVLFLMLAHVGAVFGPPPRSVSAMITVSFCAFSLLAWAWWIDRHRETVV